MTTFVRLLVAADCGLPTTNSSLFFSASQPYRKSGIPLPLSPDSHNPAEILNTSCLLAPLDGQDTEQCPGAQLCLARASTRRCAFAQNPSWPRETRYPVQGSVLSLPQGGLKPGNQQPLGLSPLWVCPFKETLIQ